MLPFLVNSEPALSAGNLLAAGGVAADSSRDETALRNDKFLEIKLENYADGD
jgi:hypothetical protein